MLKKLAVACAALIVIAPLALSSASKGVTDWPMWGGSPDRNMVSDATGLPTVWDVKTGKNIKWVAALGSQSYGNPVVAGGVVLVGTNNELLRDPKQAGDRGVLMAFRETTGEFMWQATYEKLSSGRANDWPFQGIASSPLVLDGVAYFMSNRGVVIAADLQGFHDNENDGPFKEEKLAGKTDIDVIWQFDTMEAVGNFPHNLANSSPVAFENLLYVSTGNGQDESHVNIPSPKAPAIIALDRVTGELVWEDASPGDKILHGQWSTPAVGTIGGVVQVVHGQGDGWVRGYEAKSGKKLWEFDTNPKDSVWPNDAQRSDRDAGDLRKRRLHRQRPGSRARRRRRPSLCDRRHQARRHHRRAGSIWHYDGATDKEAIRRSISTASIKDGHRLLPGLQRLPARRRSEDRQAGLEARHVRRDVELDAGRRRQGLPRRRGRRRRRHAARAREQAAADERDGQLGLFDGDYRERHDVHHDAQ